MLSVVMLSVVILSVVVMSVVAQPKRFYLESKECLLISIC
jgi:hypothetical protein